MRRLSWRCLSSHPFRSNEVFSGFAIDHGAVSWAGGDIDLAPETMYKMSYAYERIA